MFRICQIIYNILMLLIMLLLHLGIQISITYLFFDFYVIQIWFLDIIKREPPHHALEIMFKVLEFQIIFHILNVYPHPPCQLFVQEQIALSQCNNHQCNKLERTWIVWTITLLQILTVFLHLHFPLPALIFLNHPSRNYNLFFPVTIKYQQDKKWTLIVNASHPFLKLERNRM